MGKNYYERLGVKPEDSIDTIKKRYRKLVVSVHPDKHEMDSEAFRSITEAYKVLTDPEKKRLYDQKLPTEKPRVYKYHFGTSLKTTLKVKITDILSEKTKNIITTRKGLCKSCEGTGSEEKMMETCRHCLGTGVDGYSLLKGSSRACTTCKGVGKIPKHPHCKDCSGSGLKAEIMKEPIKLHPRHIFSRCVIIPGSGNCCPEGPAGDLVVELDIESDSTIRQKGLDLEKIIELSPAQAILGDDILVDVYGKKEKIRIPAGTQYGHLIEKEGAGLFIDNARGNLHLRVRIKIPQEITEEQKKLYKQLLAWEH